MGDDDTRQLELLNCLADLLLAWDVQVAGRLIEQQDLRLLIKRPCQQHSLFLPSREHRAHVSNESVITHRHREDVVMDRSQLGASFDARHVGGRVEERDVVGDRPGEQLVVLHHRADQRPIVGRAESSEADAADENFAFGSRQQPEHGPQQGCLSASRGSHHGDRFALFHFEVDSSQHERLGLGIANAEVPHLDLTADRRGGQDCPRHLRLGFRERNVGHSSRVQLQHLEIDCGVDQARHPARELGFVGHEREQHAHRELLVEHEHRA